MELNLLTLYVTVFLLHFFTYLSNHIGCIHDLEHILAVLEVLSCKAKTEAYCHSSTSPERLATANMAALNNTADE